MYSNIFCESKLMEFQSPNIFGGWLMLYCNQLSFNPCCTQHAQQSKKRQGFENPNSPKMERGRMLC